jgi:signal transduction histidine kinase
VKKKKHLRILALMIISQLLLTIFVLQWLRSQFTNEKKRMTEVLTGIYLNTQDELVDTILFKSYINPVIAHNSNKKALGVIAVADSVCNDSLKFSGEISTGQLPKWKTATGSITVNIGSDAGPDSQLPDTIMLRKTNNDLLLRSVKLIVSHTTDSGNNGKSKMMQFDLKLDSTLFTQRFGDKISGRGMKFSITWLKSIPSADSIINKSKIVINPDNPFLLPEASVTRYSGYLLNKILPQIIFGFLLVAITALAFYLSYRSIREHMIMDSLRNEFISNITHELRTPVATISVALESLGKFNLKNEPALTEQYLNLASLETKRLEELINRVLDQTLMEGNSQPLNLTETDINSLIKDVAGIMKPKLLNGGKIDIITHSENLFLICDPLFIKGALINLIENSIKYCDKTPEIKIYTSFEEGIALIMVNDNGPGIPTEYHKKVFEKFFRLPSGNIHNVKGYGLGLSFVRQVMHLHNGTVEVRNLDQGCSFILKLPAS